MLETFYNPRPTDSVQGTVVAADATHITVTAAGAWTDYYFGNFIYGSDGSVVGGYVNNILEVSGGETTFEMKNFIVSAAPLAAAVLSNDSTTQANLLFSGPDSVQGSNFGELISPGGGNDTVIALDGNDSVDGGDGNDDVNGNKGEDIVLGGAGADTVRGGQGNDTVLGGDGDDPHVNGNIGDDFVSGGNGNDTVYGGQGSDTISGDAGNDSLSGDLGNDIMIGGTGADRFYIGPGGGTDWIADFNPGEGDKIAMLAGTHYTITSSGGQVLLDLGGGTQIGLAGVAAGTFSTDWVIGV
jgi:Ca2+-binding RTX toxin-like protein